MADRLTTQLRLQASIAKAIDNLKKIGRNNYTPAKIRTRIESLKAIWMQYQEGHDLLTTETPVDTRPSMDYFHKGFFDIVEDMYNTALDYMADVLDELESARESKSSSSKDTSSSAVAPSSVHLPPIKLPPFDGKYEDWENFRSRFTSLIIQNKDLTAYTRMHFLSSCVTGRALECIRDFAITAENFSVAWSALVARFENPRRLLSVHLSTLLNLPTVTRESAAELQSLYDKISSAVSSLSNLKRSPADLWSDILVHIVKQRFDSVTRKAWTLKVNEDDTIPSFSEIKSFLASRIRAIEEISLTGPGTSATKPIASKVHVAVANTDSLPACPLCNARHYINVCPSFVNKTPNQRRDIVRSCKRCFNCLSQRHSAQECRSKYACRVCQKKHHTMLHLISDSNVTSPLSPLDTKTSTHLTDSPTPVHTLCASSNQSTHKSVLLATAWVKVSVASGHSVIARALIDQGSEVTFVSENLAQMLRSTRVRMPTSVSAVGGVTVGTIRYATHISVSPRDSSHPSLSTTALVLPSLTTYTPHRFLNWNLISHLSNIPWADPDPSSSDPINIILGADLYANVILDGIKRGGADEPFAQNSIFGWIISGPVRHSAVLSSVSVPSYNVNHVTTHHCSGLSSLEHQLKRFWELEEIPTVPIPTPLDAQCENHFVNSFSRDDTGRYVVRLPFRDGPPVDIGLSRTTAEKCLDALFRRFRSQPHLEEEYRAFFNEYYNLGHMRPAPNTQLSHNQWTLIPHHPVFKPGSSTSQLRIVFNASSVTSNGTSLNDHLLPGPKLQTDIVSVILQWRRWKFVYTADIAKMYRQIKVDNRDVDFQRILWQELPHEPLREFQLLTVTYGMTCAPFLALRVLQQLVKDEGKDYPLASDILCDNIYVDDVLFGADDVEHLRDTRDQLVSLLVRGGFRLRKWTGNSSELLSDIDDADHGLACDKSLTSDESVKILGLTWNPCGDVFRFHVSLDGNVPSSKRTVLSTIAKLYDPSGWVTPVTISAKIFMQQLWRFKLEWDDPLPVLLLNKWTRIYTQLTHLNDFQLTRWTGLQTDSRGTEIHGFADASNVAYAAAVYLRSVSSTGIVTVSLLVAKSKVAPLTPLSIPRLELSAAVLLARLIEFVQSSLKAPTWPVICWSDSTVVLDWLRNHPSRWKTFVANRVVEVFRRIPASRWRHVPTSDNPADCASRGMLGGEFLTHSLWWHGPPWLSHSSDAWPTDVIARTQEAQAEAKQTVALLTTPQTAWDLAARFSSWPKLIRVTAYVLKFVHLCRRIPSASPKSLGISLSARDCNYARIFWLKVIQIDCFPLELKAITQGKSLSPKSSILSLRPFIDSDGILRVGGRLKNAPAHFMNRNPVLLASHSITTLIVRQAHLRSLHAGTQLTLSVLRRDFWILRGRTIVKEVIFKCVRCARERAAIPTQLMGNLPAVRVTAPIRSFLHCGIDYAGPVSTRASAGRGIVSRKAYIAVFICMATKAVHLELVSDFTTPTFINAFSRFCARRGLPTSMYSDNGTNFVGADREMSKAYRRALRDPNFLNSTAADNISWHFIPPSAPHFGGLWEAGVRSVKHHLRRILGTHTLTFEEFSTLLCRIEACLNSRPIAALSDSLDDYDCLTPGHFLIGTALTVNPEPTLLDLQENRLSRWQSVIHLTERFWRLWQQDYVNTLQQRSKWKTQKTPVTVGQLVLLRNSGLPPCKWELGRVVHCHAGTDGLVRVVTVKTAASEFKRPIAKLCLLPVQHPADSS